MKIIIETQQDIDNFKLLKEMFTAISMYVENKGIATYNIDLSKLIESLVNGVGISSNILPPSNE